MNFDGISIALIFTSDTFSCFYQLLRGLINQITIAEFDTSAFISVILKTS